MPLPDADAPVRAIIVDDEPFARDAIRLALRRTGGVEVVAECGEGEDAARAILAHDPDLVFLDVHMPGLDGFDVIERVGVDRMPPVVFVTAYDEHALRAFEVHALDYVLKPFDDARLAQAVSFARERIAREGNRSAAQALAVLLRERGNETPSGGYAQRIKVEHDERIRFVRVADVAYFEADRNYVRVHAGDAEHRIRAPLTRLLDRLDPRIFVRIHRSTVVNVEHIREVQPWFGGDYVAILLDGRQLKVSRRYRDALLRTTL